MHSKRLAAFVVLVMAVSMAGAGTGLAGAVHHTDAGAQEGAQAECEFPVTVTDATGEEMTIEEPPERVVVLQPSTAQTAHEIGIWDRVVGAPVGPYISYLDDHDEPEDITEEDGLTVVNERVVELEPDLVLAAAVADEDGVEQLRESGLTVYKFESATSLEDVYDKTLLTGELTDACDGAEETVDWMQEEIDTVENAVEGEERPLVLYAMGDGWTAGQGTFIEEIIETAGATNLGSEAEVEFYGQLSDEVVVEQDPDWIVYPDHFEEPPVSEEVAEETTAMQEDQVTAVDANYMNQPAPRVVYAIVELVETLHPEAYDEAVSTAEDGAEDEATENETEDEATENETEDEATENETEDDETTDQEQTQEDGNETSEEDADEDDEGAGGEDMPGFGVVAALIAAIVGGLYALGRR